MTLVEHTFVGSFTNWKEIITELNLEDELQSVVDEAFEEVEELDANLIDEKIAIKTLDTATENYLLRTSGPGDEYQVFQIDYSDQPNTKRVIKHPQDPVGKCPGCNYEVGTTYSLEGEEDTTGDDRPKGLCGDCFSGTICTHNREVSSHLVMVEG